MFDIKGKEYNIDYKIYQGWCATWRRSKFPWKMRRTWIHHGWWKWWKEVVFLHM